MRTMRTIAAAFSASMRIDLHASNANNSCSFLSDQHVARACMGGLKNMVKKAIM